MITTIVILIITSAFLVWGKIRSDIVAMLSLLALVLSDVLTSEEALAGFSNSIVIMIAALFIVGGGISQTGLAVSLSKNVLKLGDNNPKKLFVLIMGVTVFIGSFLSNTGTAALLMPIVVSVAAEANMNVRRLLMPMAFACSVSGMMTLIGTPAILIAHKTLQGEGYAGFQFFTPLPVGLFLLVVGTLVLWFLTQRLDKKGKGVSEKKTSVKTPGQLISEYRLVDNLYRVEIPKKSSIIGKPLADLGITSKYLVTIAQVRSQTTYPLKRSVTRIPDGTTFLSEGESIFVLGDYDNVCRFVEDFRLSFIDSRGDEENKNKNGARKLKFDEIGIAEVVILANLILNTFQTYFSPYMMK